jgi:hypothetical protein
MRDPGGPRGQEPPERPPEQHRFPRARVLLYKEQSASTGATRPDESLEPSAHGETETKKEADAHNQVSAVLWKRAEFIFAVLLLLLILGWAAMLFLPAQVF